jgi:iron complex transport system permease protein
VSGEAPASRIERLHGRLVATIAGLLLLLGVTIFVALSYGASEVRLWQRLFGGAWGPAEEAILYGLRLPRVFAAAAIGGLLGVSGVAFQAILRNPLADPYVLGVSGGASLGGVVALVAVGGELSIFTLLLTGAIFNALSAAIIYFLQSVASREELQAIVFYLMGRVPSLPFPSIAALAAAGVGVTLVFFAAGRDWNALSTGEEGARQLGVDVERLKRRAFVLGAVATALAVASAGLIGFVGLVVPHLLRQTLGPDHRLLVPASFLGGAAFLVLADAASRTLAAPTELPVGVVTALVGGPLFLVVLRRRGRRSGGAR